MISRSTIRYNENAEASVLPASSGGGAAQGPHQNIEFRRSGMSVEQTNKIDFLWKDEQRGRVMLTVSDHLDWEEDRESHFLLLQDKLNTYFYFIKSGQLLKAKPEYKGFPVGIHVRAKYQLSEEAAKFYRLAAESAAKVGVTLEFDYAP
jgi:hypothetical protein